MASLRDQLDRALRLRQHDEALRLYTLIEERQKNEPRWPRRKGDLLQRMNRKPEAIEAYDHAAELYAAQGFHARAAAVAKVVATIDSGNGAGHHGGVHEARRNHWHWHWD